MFEEAASVLNFFEDFKSLYDCEDDSFFLKELFFFHQFIESCKDYFINTKDIFDLSAPFFGLFNDLVISNSIEFIFEDEFENQSENKIDSLS